jgi:hypothetical protein
MVTSSRSSDGDITVAVWWYAGSLDDIWEGEMRAVNLGAVDVLLCNQQQTSHGIIVPRALNEPLP